MKIISSKFVAACIGATLLGGCGWASRNVYREPEGEAVGSVTLVNATLARTTVSFYEDPKTCQSPKVIAAYDADPMRTVKANYSESFTIGLVVVGVAPDKISQCSGIYTLPFTRGQLRVTMAKSDEGCAFLFEDSTTGSEWTRRTDIVLRKSTNIDFLVMDKGCEPL